MRHRLVGMALLTALSVMPAVAHHTLAAEYDWTKAVTINGSVARFEWGNPHSTLTVKGKDETGTQAEWTVELGGSERLEALGWNERRLESGDRVSVDGWLAKDGTGRLSAKSVTTPAGLELAAANSFFDGVRASVQSRANPRQAN
jgi:hypothetical protein